MTVKFATRKLKRKVMTAPATMSVGRGLLREQTRRIISLRKRGLVKRSFIAVILNCLIPGAGLWYLGKPLWAALNLLVVFAIGVALLFSLPAETIKSSFHYFVLCYAAGSGGFAHYVATRTAPSSETSSRN